MKALTRAAAALVFATSAAHADTLTVVPAQPRYMEPVYVRIQANTGIHVQGAQVTMAGNILEVTYQAVIDIGQPLPFDVMLGRLPAGGYTVRTTGLGGTTTTAFTVAPVPLEFPARTHPAVNYTDLWWNPAEPGWGINIVQGPTNRIFASWLVYDEARRPVWYTLQPGEWNGGRTFTGPIYRTSGPPLGVPFDPASVTEARVGTGTLTFQGFDTAIFSYTLGSAPAVAKFLRRMPIE